MAGFSVKVEFDEEKFFEMIEGFKKNNPDFLEVVRCKDCKWWKEIGCAIRIVDETDEPKEYDFCSFGERKDGGEQ